MGPGSAWSGTVDGDREAGCGGGVRAAGLWRVRGRSGPPALALVADRAGAIAGAGNWWARPRSTTLGAAAPDGADFARPQTATPALSGR